MITRDVKIFFVIYKSHIQGKSWQVFTSIFVKTHSCVAPNQNLFTAVKVYCVTLLVVF